MGENAIRAALDHARKVLDNAATPANVMESVQLAEVWLTLASFEHSLFPASSSAA